jgi:beta-glucanase (GH16 family)
MAGGWWTNLPASVQEIAQKYGVYQAPPAPSKNAPQPILSISDAVVTEGARASVVVSLSNAYSKPLIVGYSTANGTAGSPDFVSRSGTLTFAPGQTQKTIHFATVQDSVDEPQETFTVALAPPQETKSKRSVATVTINDDDEPPSATDRPDFLPADYRLTFVDSFDSKATLSNIGITGVAKWLTHFPDQRGSVGTFGSEITDVGQFGDPYSVSNGVLNITATKVGDTWHLAQLASMDSGERGFLQKYGYFEMRAKLPTGEGVWPAFFMFDKKATVSDAKELDILEAYGSNQPDKWFTAIHYWQNDKDLNETDTPTIDVSGMTTDFHTYGCLWTPEKITFYLDGVAKGSIPTPEWMNEPMYLLVSLANGGRYGGYPSTNMPSPSVMQVDYVRAFSNQPK